MGVGVLREFRITCQIGWDKEEIENCPESRLSCRRESLLGSVTSSILWVEREMQQVLTIFNDFRASSLFS